MTSEGVLVRQRERDRLRVCAPEKVRSAAADLTEVRSGSRFPLPEAGIDQAAATPERLGRERSQAAEMLRRLRAQ